MNEKLESTSRFITAQGVAIASPLAVVLAYGWGMAYDETFLSYLGFKPSLLPLPTPQVYKQAYFAMFEAFRTPLELLQNSFTYWGPWLIALISLISLLAAFISTEKLGRFLVNLKGSSANPGKKMSIPPALSKFILTLALLASIVICTILTIQTILVIAGIVVYPPAYLGRMAATSLINNEAYKSWPKITWKDDENSTQSGYLLRCSDLWCGVIVDGKAIMIQAQDVKVITGVPLYAPSSHRDSERLSSSQSSLN